MVASHDAIFVTTNLQCPIKYINDILSVNRCSNDKMIHFSRWNVAGGLCAVSSFTPKDLLVEKRETPL